MLCPVAVRKKDTLGDKVQGEMAGSPSTRHLQVHALSLGVEEGTPAMSLIVNRGTQNLGNIS